MKSLHLVGHLFLWILRFRTMNICVNKKYISNVNVCRNFKSMNSRSHRNVVFQKRRNLVPTKINDLTINCSNCYVIRYYAKHQVCTPFFHHIHVTFFLAGHNCEHVLGLEIYFSTHNSHFA